MDSYNLFWTFFIWVKWLWSLRPLNENFISPELNLNLGQLSWSFSKAYKGLGIDSWGINSEVLKTLSNNILYWLLFCTAYQHGDWFPTESELQLVTISYKQTGCISDPQISMCRLVTLKLICVNFKIIDFLGCLYWRVWLLLVRE